MIEGGGRNFEPGLKHPERSPAPVKLQLMVEVDLPEYLGVFQEVEAKIKEAVFEAGRCLMNQVMEKKEFEILKGKRFWKKDQREKKFQTIVGEIKRKRWRVFDWKEKKERYPLDEWMGVGHDRATPALRKVLVTASVQRPYRQATREVEQWTGVKRSAMANWRLVQQIAREEMEKEVPVSDWYLRPIPALDPGMKGDPCPILAMDPDATYVKNQDSKAPDHEIKMMVMYTGKKPEGKNKKRLRLVDKQVLFSRADEDVRGFFNRGTVLAMRHYGAHRGTKAIIHGDGDPWIRGYKENYWDQALIRLDPWHVGKKIRLATGLKEVPKGWWKLIYGQPDLLVNQLAMWKVQRTAPKSKEREKMEELIGYIKNNREGLLPSKVPLEVKRKYFGMYKRGSGTIESNIGHGIADRFKQRRMSWSKQGLGHLSFLREKFLNGERKSLFRVPEPIGRNNWRKKADEVGL